MSDRMERLLRKNEELQAQINKETEEVAKRQQRKLTKQKILLGAMCLEWMEEEPRMAPAIMGRMERFLSRKGDREVFNFGWPPSFPPAPANNENQAADGDTTVGTAQKQTRKVG